VERLCGDSFTRSMLLKPSSSSTRCVSVLVVRDCEVLNSNSIDGGDARIIASVACDARTTCHTTRAASEVP
jgi:hypothetical protein